VSETLDPMATDVDQQELAQQLLAQARERGIELVGPDGLLNRLTKNVLETTLEAEMDDHLGYEKHDVAGRGSGNSRNGTLTKAVLTEIGPQRERPPGLRRQSERAGHRFRQSHRRDRHHRGLRRFFFSVMASLVPWAFPVTANAQGRCACAGEGACLGNDAGMGGGRTGLGCVLV